jgi:hypothetical protein
MSAEEIELRLKKKEFADALKNYKKTQHIFLMTSRFNNRTVEENKKFREKGWPNGCVYCSPQKISDSIPFHSKLMVLEMNNDINRIIAIGLCLNSPFAEKYSVYEDANYNRYSYVGKYRIERENLDVKEEAVFKALDILCFTGNEHMKRGDGIKQFPTKLLYNCRDVLDIPSFIENMFKIRFSKKNI